VSDNLTFCTDHETFNDLKHIYIYFEIDVLITV